MKLTALFALPWAPPAQTAPVQTPAFVATARPRVSAHLINEVRLDDQLVHGVRMTNIPAYKPTYESASERCP